MPTCDCHGEPKLWNKDKRLRAGGFFFCAVKHREQGRARYDRDVIYRIRQIDRSRRNYALKRRRERQLGRANG